MSKRFKINENGSWDTDTSIGHHHDNIFSDYLLRFISETKIETLVDFGCGTASYVKEVKKSTGIFCEAYDGNPNTEKITDGIGKVLDLSKKVNLKKQYDCVLSLEVGEHLPKKYEQVYIDNITRHVGNLLIISWAIIGQGGDGHVNCQNNHYIIEQVEKRGLKYNDKESLSFRKHVSNAHWFKNTIMVFNKV